MEMFDSGNGTDPTAAPTAVPRILLPWMSAVAFAMLTTFTIFEIGVCVISWQRRTKFPLTGLPINWHIVAHLAIVVGMFANYLEVLMPEVNTTRCYIFFALNVLSPFAMGSLVAQFFYIWFSAYLQHLSVTQTESKYIRKQNQKKFAAYSYLFVIITTWLTSMPTFAAYFTNTYSRTDCRAPNANAISGIGPAIAVLCIILGAFKLRKVQEAFNLKNQYKKFAIFLIVTAIVGTALSYADAASGWFFRQAAISFGFFGYPIFCGYFPIKRSFEAENLRARMLNRRSSTVSAKKDGASLRVSPGMGRPAKTAFELKYLLSTRTDLLEGLSAYTVKEFCVENALFLKTLFDYQREKGSAERLTKAKTITNTFIKQGTTSELNISMSLRKSLLTKLSTLTESEAVPELFDQVETQVLGMLLDPFNRFLMADGFILSSEDFKGADLAAGAARGSVSKPSGQGPNMARLSVSTAGPPQDLNNSANPASP